MTNWLHVQTLIGETVREIGILILVFAPMEAAFAEGPLNRGAMAVALLLAILAVSGGIILESRR